MAKYRERTCEVCQAKYDLEIDHIIPLAKGGSSKDSNLQATHRACNSIKADLDLSHPTVALLRAQIAAN